jgi:hypothetical protein
MTRFALAVAAALVAAPVFAQSAGVELGQLTCRQTGRSNLVIVSDATFDCVFEPTGDRARERYEGVVQKIGVDLSTTKQETIVWLVFAPGATPEPGALEGVYAGASADVSLGVGAGAKLLVGGDARRISLQPAALSGQEGYGAAVGLESFKLAYKGVAN